MITTAPGGPPGRFQVKKEETQTIVLNFLFEIIYAFSAPFAYLFLMCRMIHQFLGDVKFFTKVLVKNSFHPLKYFVAPMDQ